MAQFSEPKIEELDVLEQSTDIMAGFNVTVLFVSLNRISIHVCKNSWIMFLDNVPGISTVAKGVVMGVVTGTCIVTGVVTGYVTGVIMDDSGSDR